MSATGSGTEVRFQDDPVQQSSGVSIDFHGAISIPQIDESAIPLPPDRLKLMGCFWMELL